MRLIDADAILAILEGRMTVYTEQGDEGYSDNIDLGEAVGRTCELRTVISFIEDAPTISPPKADNWWFVSGDKMTPVNKIQAPKEEEPTFWCNGKLLKDIMKARGLDSRTLARRSGVAKDTIKHMRNCKGKSKLSTFSKVETALGIASGSLRLKE